MASAIEAMHTALASHSQALKWPFPCTIASPNDRASKCGRKLKRKETAGSNRIHLPMQTGKMDIPRGLTR
jgi:hypothetical protein